MRFFILFFFFLAVIGLHAQSLTAKEAIESIQDVISKHAKQENSAKLLHEVKAIDRLEFVDNDAYWKFLQAADSLHAKDNKYYIDLLFYIGKEFSVNEMKREAFPYLYKVLLLQQKGAHLKEECAFYEILGDSYFFFKRYEQAKLFLLKALECNGTTEKSKININNTLGLIYGKKEATLAERHFKKGIAIALKENNMKWYGIINGNLGALHLNRRELDAAQKYLEVDAIYSQKHDEPLSAVAAIASLIQIHLQKNEQEKAQHYILLLDSIVEKFQLKQMNFAYFDAKSVWNAHIGNFKEAYQNELRAQSIIDSIEFIRNDLNSKNMEFQIDFEQRLANVKILEEQSKSHKQILIGLVVLIFSICLGGGISVAQILKRKKREKELLELKNKKAKEHVSKMELELETVLKNLMEKNETITQLNDDLSKMFSEVNSSDAEKKALTDKLQSFTLLTDENWLQFKHLFEERYPGFFHFFQNKYEGMTNAELRLAALLKLNLENLEISKALGIGPDSVRKTNLRLRKRLDIEDQKELLKLIQSIPHLV